MADCVQSQVCNVLVVLAALSHCVFLTLYLYASTHHSGILVPGGFGDRGIEGMIAAARYAREHKKPYLGVCLDLQIAVIGASTCILVS